MDQTRHLRRAARIVMAVCSSLLGALLFAPTAFAMIMPPPGGASDYVLARPHPTAVHTVAGGMAGWQIALIAVGAALVTATVAVLIDRTRAARRRVSVSAA